MKKYAILIFCFSLVLPVKAFACSLEAAKNRNTGAFEKATSVFHAKITESKLVQMAHPNDPEKLEDVVRIKYEVIEEFKGSPPNYLVAPILDFCGYGSLIPGFDYIIYAQYHNEIRANIVSPATEMMRGLFGESDSKDQEMLELVRKQAKHYKRDYNK